MCQWRKFGLRRLKTCLKLEPGKGFIYTGPLFLSGPLLWVMRNIVREVLHCRLLKEVVEDPGKSSGRNPETWTSQGVKESVCVPHTESMRNRKQDVHDGNDKYMYWGQHSRRHKTWGLWSRTKGIRKNGGNKIKCIKRCREMLLFKYRTKIET